MQNGARTQVQSELGADPALPPLAKPLRLPANALPVRLTEAGFSFLNRTVDFGPPVAIDWNYPDLGKLWTYNLNYFEYLRQPGLNPPTGEALILSWVAAEASHKDGWEPYPNSLRLVNWLQFYRSSGMPVPDKVHHSICRQYVNLRGKLEYHLGGNHLLENALALAVTARYLNDKPGIRKADKMLRTELSEQYLPDGSHYERSVMYHLVLLWRQLDVYSWVSVSEAPADTELAQMLKDALVSQLAYADYIVTPDGRFPHFNDSSAGIAPDWGAVRAYASGLGLLPENPDAQRSLLRSGRLKVLDDSGYRVWNFSAAHSLFIDAAPIGPDDIPGHAHADSLSFVLYVAGQPVVIDPAISTYEKNARRAWERSTVAHNTVTVGNNLNSSDVWGGFRVGKRARTTILADKPGLLTARHNGFPGTRHTRTWREADNIITIDDHLTGTYTTGTARLHFAPGLGPVLSENTLSVAGCLFTFVGATNLSLFDYQAATGWNELADARGVAIKFSTSLRIGIRTRSDDLT